MKRSTQLRLIGAAMLPTMGLWSATTSLGAVGYVSYTGGTYTQNFDSLAYQAGAAVNSASPVTLNVTNQANASVTYSLPAASSGATYSFSDTTLGSNGTALATNMDGWYGDSVGGSDKYGAQDGSTTTGGQISFGTATGTASSPGTDANRALGLLNTSSTVETQFAIELVNNSGSTIDSLSNINFMGELWRQSNLAKTLTFSYAVTAPLTGSAAAIPQSGTAADTNLNVSFGTNSNDTGGVAVIGSQAANQNQLSDSDIALTTPWTNGNALWLIWTMSDDTGKAQGLAIDNFSFTGTSVPEPASLGLMTIATASTLIRRRRRA